MVAARVVALYASAFLLIFKDCMILLQKNAAKECRSAITVSLNSNLSSQAEAPTVREQFFEQGVFSFQRLKQIRIGRKSKRYGES